MSWLVLVDQERDFSNADTPHKVMTTRDYLSRPQLFKDVKPKIINLSRSYGYQGSGYYCSLLAEARGHRIMPPVETMAELTRKDLYRHALPELDDMLRWCLEKATAYPEKFQLLVCFGQVEDQALIRFSRLLFDWFRAPVLRVSVSSNGRRIIDRIVPAPINTLNDQERDFLRSALDAHTRGTWRAPKARSVMKYSLAVLIDLAEEIPPSTQTSLKHLARIAEKSSIDVEPIQRNDLDRLAEFDALFIRATTAIDNYTYRFARRAQQEGMPVIDDPQSMIRCTNKVFLAELLTGQRLPTPKTLVVQSTKQAAELPEKLGWPVVLKIPDGSFSRGVYKCESAADLKEKLAQLLDDSDLVIAQEYVPTTFDWRIGVLGGEPLYACQYLMARKHWQIVKHGAGKPAEEGGSKTVALKEAPPEVVETAVKAARLIGDGLYGVDLKQTANGLFVIEINDNPDLNHGVEDAAEKDAVWEKLVRWFYDRLEA
jgi:glutathione synthase/RimK-type ligase-like ATP-grasp enzyme